MLFIIVYLLLNCNACIAAKVGDITEGNRAVSVNVPLTSYVYDYLEKLDGLGYLKDMRIGSKPYTRNQVARWIEAINIAINADPNAASFAKAMVQDLNADFKDELSRYAGQSKIAVKGWSLQEYYYDGDNIQYSEAKGNIQPLNINNDGRRLAEKSNTLANLRIEGNVNGNLAVSLTPELDINKSDTEIRLNSGYVKAGLGNTSIQIGKDAIWWGQGYRGSLLITNNAKPQTAIIIKNIEPEKAIFKFLGESNTTVFYSILENDREDVPYPSFAGIRKDYTPNENFTVGLAMTSIIGGKGHMLSRGDYWHFVKGENANISTNDKWDAKAGLDFRWRLPGQGGIQLYGEIYGEDQAKALHFLPTPSENAIIAGVYLPRISADGAWDAKVEWGHTRSAWYRHWLYTNGYTYCDNIIGDAMGANAHRYFLQLNHYNAGNKFSVNFERLNRAPFANENQQSTAVWMSMRSRMDNGRYLEGMAGVADTDRNSERLAFNSKNYILGLRMVKEY